MDKTALNGIIFSIITGMVIGTVAALATPPEASHAADKAQVIVDETEFDAIFVPAGHEGPFILAGDAAGERAF
jgi:hypothetical protein